MPSLHAVFLSPAPRHSTGVVLRMLEDDPELASTTHVLVDEVHERTVEGSDGPVQVASCSPRPEL